MRLPFPSLRSPAILSPMAGVTDIAFRMLCREYGASLTYTEFVSSAGLVRNNRQSHQLIRTDKHEHPVGVQLFGSDVAEVVSAAQMVEHAFDVIDINCGCPAWKVIKTGAGSQLLDNPSGIGRLVGTIVDEVDTPVTIKIRSGIDHKNINAVEVACAAQDAGAAAVAIHGRTQSQGYTGLADWDIIKKVKDALDIPVIGNGDVWTPETFEQRLEYSGVDAILLARGAAANPYLFRQIEQYRQSGSYEKQPYAQVMSTYLTYAQRYETPFSVIRQHAMRLTKGMEQAGNIRKLLQETSDITQIQNIIDKVSVDP